MTARARLHSILALYHGVRTDSAQLMFLNDVLVNVAFPGLQWKLSIIYQNIREKERGYPGVRVIKWLIERIVLSGVGGIRVYTALDHPAVGQWLIFIIILPPPALLVQAGVGGCELEDVLLWLELPHLLVLVVVVLVVLLLPGRLLLDEFVEGEAGEVDTGGGGQETEAAHHQKAPGGPDLPTGSPGQHSVGRPRRGKGGEVVGVD